MREAFIQSIYAQNSTTIGRETLYQTLSQEESHQWEGISNTDITNWITVFENIAIQYPEKNVIIETQTNQTYSYQALNEAGNKVANFLQNHTGEKYIGLNFPNSFLFLAALIGINKAGCTAILFNNREPANRLKTLAQKNQIKIVLGNEIEGLIDHDIHHILSNSSAQKYTNPHANALEDPAFVIFTSGTSGPSKPALFSHRRMIGAGIAWSLRTAMESEDRCYIPLPLYHGNALAVAFSSVITAGATAVIRPKFSVSSFFEDINTYRCSHMVYIGELWRYLITSDNHTSNPNKYLKVIFGNGLNKSLWQRVIKRYEIQHVVEHFGATEMPAGALTNWMNIAGFCGYIPPSIDTSKEMMLVDEHDREVGFNQNGEALFLVESGKYQGYLDPTLDNTKVTPNLRTHGDLWWRSGDLLKRDSEGFYTFIERLGDSYRFKGENVACADVEEAIREIGGYQEVVVYGITLPHIDGKIGMASLVPHYGSVDLPKLYRYLQAKLASYALPYIIKIEREKHQTTSTLKIQKTKLSKEGIRGYSSGNYYILYDDCYTPLDQNMYEKIIHGEILLGTRSKK
ncbi:MAG: AMP-binding protein [Epsilonproteobacteria bacterium]|nr:AMP-binding protein [Campylobacterota bacterium]